MSREILKNSNFFLQTPKISIIIRNFFVRKALYSTNQRNFSVSAGIFSIFDTNFTVFLFQTTMHITVTLRTENNAFLCHCEAFRPKQSQKTNGFRLLRFARNDKNVVFPWTLTIALLSSCCVFFQQFTWPFQLIRNYLKTVTLSEAKGLASRNKRFFAEFILERSEGLRMTICVLK